MGKLKRTVTSILFVVVLIFIITLFTDARASYVPKGELTNTEIKDAFEILNDTIDNPRYTYVDYLSDRSSQIIYGLNTVVADVENNEAVLDPERGVPSLIMDKDVVATYDVTVATPGYYHIGVDYLISEMTLNEITVSVQVNGETFYKEMETIDLPIIWMDESKDYQTDRYGDQVLPNSVLKSGWKHFRLYNNTYISVDPLLFYFEAGQNLVEIKNTTSSRFTISTLTLTAPTLYMDYTQYDQLHGGDPVKHFDSVDAINYIEKNSSYVQPFALGNNSVRPFDPVYKKLNIIDGLSWRRSGQALIYEIEVPETGRYKIALHYANYKNDFQVLRSIAIDGKIPFAELKAYRFDPTINSAWKNEVLQSEDGDPFYFYLTKGTHTLTVRAENEPLQNSLRKIQLVVDHINTFALEIRKITGKEIDKNRTWKFTDYIPETPQFLESYIVMMKAAITDLSQYAPNGAQSATLSELQKALARAENIYKDYERIPLYLDDLTGGTSSIALFLGNALTVIGEQPMYFDEIYLYHGEKLPKANANFFIRTLSSIESFISSFTSNKYSLTKEKNVVDIWVNRPITYVDMMQKMADQTFTPDTGIKVKISVMPDANKLIMASAANQQPDVALGLASYMPYDLAIRGAAYDLSSFPDYWEFASQFAPGAFVPYILNDKAYAMPETLDFNVIIYRTDIFNALNLPVPDTWDEVIELLPELQQYGMNFYHPIAGGTAIKWFYQTSGFVYQFGGNLYQPDGLRANINTPEAVQGLTYLTQLFTNYSLPEQVQSFYNSFRYATLPIGITDFATYQLIKNAAPELVGQWAIAPYPSITVDGKANRYYIANGTASMIMQETDQPDESWAFLKWWLSTDTQSQFAFKLQSTYGPTYAWISGNINAFINSPFPEKDKEVILEQIKWLIDVPRTPGQYMLERSISDIWNTSVFDATPTGVAIDSKTILINREIRKKMIEFGFLDRDGNVIKPYSIRDISWVQQQMLAASGGYHGSND